MKERGQSLTEMAVIMPVLLMVLFGLLTIGRLMHAHLVVIGLSRDLARAAIREDGLDWYGNNKEAIGYYKLENYLTEIAAGYGWLDLETNTSATVHLLEFDAGRLCLIDPCLLDCAEIHPDDLDTSDDFRQSPAQAPLWFDHWGADSLAAGAVDYEARLDEMEQATIKLACAAQMRQPGNVEFRDEKAVIVEVAYRMDWWLIPGSVEVRRQTMMRGRS